MGGVCWEEGWGVCRGLLAGGREVREEGEGDGSKELEVRHGESIGDGAVRLAGGPRLEGILVPDTGHCGLQIMTNFFNLQLLILAAS